MRDRAPAVTASLGFGMQVNSDRKRPGGARTIRGCIPRILVVDKDPALRHVMMARLRAEDYEVECADDSVAALDACRRFRPNLLITDLRMHPMHGAALLAELKSRWPDVSVIVLTGPATIPEAVRAIQSGAFGFLVKPIRKSELLGQVQRAIAACGFTQRKTDWRAHIASRGQLMEDRLVRANCAARSSVAVLLSGENGAARELFARAIHAASSRRDDPFVVVRCGESAEHRLETELFGRAGGAYKADRPLAAGSHGGTLLLDEICDLPMRLQVRLVAALRDWERGVGGSAAGERKVARLICSSSVDLRRLLRAGRFYDDLYYRISIMSIEVPPLGRRREDIPLLVSSFLEQAAEEGRTGKLYSPNAVQLLTTADWPGNVRRLFDFVRRNIALAGDRATAEDTGGSPPGRASAEAKRRRADFYRLLSYQRSDEGMPKKSGERSGFGHQAAVVDRSELRSLEYSAAAIGGLK